MFKILFFGDIIGSLGRKTVIEQLPSLREEHSPDLIVANVENLAHGRGITAKTLQELDAAGVDAYTSGNHVWENPVGLSCFGDSQWKDRLVRPANVDPARAGRGATVVEKNGVRVLLVNLMGQLFMKDTLSSPFLALDRILNENTADLQLVDIHTEATSEKEALGHYADGRVTAVFGTHTHVPTADAKILPGGTAYVTDVGRNGGHDSVVGFEKNAAVKRFLDPTGKAYEPTDEGPAELNAMLLMADPKTGLSVSLDRIRKIC
ncbi:MAG: TIGR00282 family metallophosphoesterase [Patescibacteria group bacterium]